ncbi:MAG: class II fructose-bisphosphatase [Rickettsiales bacterium]
MKISLFKRQQANQNPLPKNLIVDAKALTEASAIECYEWIGVGDEKAADQAAVTAMRRKFNEVDIDGTIVIGEGERDEAPMLFIGEKVGRGDFKVDIAVDPLEGTTICAHALPGSIATLAFATKGGFLHAPDVYMDKIAIGAGYPDGVVDLDNSAKQNVNSLAKAKKCDVSDLMVTILKRPRHDELIAKVREAGARIQLISDGDVAGVIATSMPETTADMYMGQGGAPEGVLAAAALRCIGGQMQGRLIFRNEDEKKRAYSVGIKDLNKKYKLLDLASGDVIFSATGVTDGWFLDGVKYTKNFRCITHSVVMESSSQTINYLKTIHRL